MKVTNLPIRLDEDLIDLVNDLRSQGALSFAIKVYLKALKVDRAGTIAYLLGTGEDSVNTSKLRHTVESVHLLEEYKNVTGDISLLGFQKWVSERGTRDLGNGLTREDVQEAISVFRDQYVADLTPPEPVIDGDNLVSEVSQMLDQRFENLLASLESGLLSGKFSASYESKANLNQPSPEVSNSVEETTEKLAPKRASVSLAEQVVAQTASERPASAESEPSAGLFAPAVEHEPVTTEVSEEVEESTGVSEDVSADDIVEMDGTDASIDILAGLGMF